MLQKVYDGAFVSFFIEPYQGFIEISVGFDDAVFQSAYLIGSFLSVLLNHPHRVSDFHPFLCVPDVAFSRLPVHVVRMVTQ